MFLPFQLTARILVAQTMASAWREVAFAGKAGVVPIVTNWTTRRANASRIVRVTESSTSRPSNAFAKDNGREEIAQKVKRISTFGFGCMCSQATNPH